ncbi:MAG TPA: hypothetical protein VGZ32_05285 [Actinocrinis sp.]|uniref:hypothetical protein n=1 Tax=Actinocrinis sp. TaxID=1920516 RepID=UPI002DDDAD95|nr:hypothetical protein [Actinocrinis sp.]HEV3169726.1 hypothetical protein [Actinocrinis sp.]
MTILVHSRPAGPSSAVRRAFSGTPRRLTALGAGLVAAIAVFIVVLTSGMAGARGGMSAISAKAAEANAANELYFRLTDMDAQAADALLVGFNPTTLVPTAVSAAAAMKTYQDDRAAAGVQLQLLGLNPALSGPETGLLDDLGDYESLIGQAMNIDQNTANEAPAAPPGAALTLYQSASTEMHNLVLKDAAKIRDEDFSEIDSRYTSAHDAAIAFTGAIVVLGLLLLALIVGANQYLSHKFRRIVGPALALAAVTVIATTAAAAAGLGHEAHQYKVAKLNAFDSVSALTTAKADSYDANADESRWLLNRTEDNQTGFYSNVDQIAHLPGLDVSTEAGDPGAYDVALANAVHALTLNRDSNTVSNVTLTGGFLATELNNITFDNEAQGAYNSALAFSRYIHDDVTIRDYADNGNLSAAVAVDIGLDKGQSNYDFGQYIDDLQGVIGINQQAFTAAVSDGQSTAAPWTWLPYVIGVLLLALVGVALYPRLAEYR